MATDIPDFLSHYYDASKGPFRNVSDLDLTDAEVIQQSIRDGGLGFASKRSQDYLHIRRELEDRVREQSISRGGVTRRQRPHYAILGSCPWLLSWYPNGNVLRLAIAWFKPETLSFTYGDTFPAMRIQDEKPSWDFSSSKWLP